MAMALITGLASLLHPKTHLICLGNTDRIAKAIFWLAIYGPSGTGKVIHIRRYSKLSRI